MKCRKCRDSAVINMRQHKLALCKDHFISWIHEQTDRSIRRYSMFTRDERVLVAVSGGKDSLALWEILLNLGYQADGLYIGLGIDGGIDYSNESYRFVKRFADNHPEARLHVVDLEIMQGAGIETASQLVRRGKPCSACGVSKRYIMNRVAHDEGYDVLATGHNLDDEAATLFGNTLHWIVGYLERQGPVLPSTGDGLARKVKPLFRFYEREMAAYCLLQNIDYIYDECPFSEGATSIKHKDILNQMDSAAPGTKVQFYLSFLRAREEHGIFTPQKGQARLNSCPECGQLTTNDGRCSFCSLWDRVRERQAEQAKVITE
jgi:uncharacterized protein (TIGR00269 family)